MQTCKKITCKQLDAYKSFLSRLNKIGSSYIKHNDVWCLMDKLEMKAFDGPLPGIHIIKDPIPDDNYIKDKSYLVENVGSIISDMNNVSETMTDLRRNAQLVWVTGTNTGLVRISYSDDVYVNVAVTPKEPQNDLERDILQKVDIVGATVTTFKEELEEHPEFPWNDLSEESLIKIRNGERWDSIYTHGSKGYPVRLVKPLFPLAGASRLNTPIAQTCAYRVIPEKGTTMIATLQIRARYTCLSGSNIVIDAIHKYKQILY